MTTIAYRHGMMACDSCWAYVQDQQTSQTKIARLKSGGLLGQAGDADSRSLVVMFDNVKKEQQLPGRKEIAELHTEFAGLFVLPTGAIFLIDCERTTDEDHIYTAQLWPVGRFGFAAVGSGRLLALGAMAAGRSAQQAVAIACKFDINSREPVHVTSLRKPEKKK